MDIASQLHVWSIYSQSYKQFKTENCHNASRFKLDILAAMLIDCSLKDAWGSPEPTEVLEECIDL